MSADDLELGFSWLRRVAISETLAHLEYAVYEGRLVTHRQDGIVRYERTPAASK